MNTSSKFLATQKLSNNVYFMQNKAAKEQCLDITSSLNQHTCWHNIVASEAGSALSKMASLMFWTRSNATWWCSGMIRGSCLFSCNSCMCPKLFSWINGSNIFRGLSLRMSLLVLKNSISLGWVSCCRDQIITFLLTELLYCVSCFTMMPFLAPPC